MGSTDGLDVDALLEGAIDGNNGAGDTKENTKAMRSRSRSGSRDRKRRKSRSRSRDRKRSTSRSRDRKRSRSRSRDHKRRRSRSRSRDRRRSRSRDRGYSRSSGSRDYRRRSRTPPRRSRIPDRRRSPPRRLPGPERRDVMPFNPRGSPPKNAKMDLSAEERDQRTLLIMQIARDTRPRDLEEFFSAVGAVRDVRIITDSKTGRSKGICYVEFWEEESVPLGLALNGQRLMGAPLQIQRTCAERNRAANASVATNLGFGIPANKGPTKLCVENLHPKINEKMLEEVFDSFGRIEKVEMQKDMNGDGIGTAFLLFRNAEDATKALEQLNNFEIAGKCMRLSIQDSAVKREEASIHQRSLDDMDNKQGILLGSGGRQQLMAKLAQGTGSGMELTAQAQLAANHARDSAIPAIATQCFLLSNMFDPSKETEPNWDADIRDDVIEQCLQHGGALHVYVDKGSEQGNVYVKCPSVAIAHLAVTALHGRWFSGKVITANYVPVNSYHELFPDAMNSRSVLQARGVAVPPTPMNQVMNPAMNGYGYGVMPPPPPGPPGPPFGGYY